ncbi:phytoene synthase [Sulfolobus sp. A20]|uniref:phytoene/squalene synthase family protein n=1 Tax=Sulfolobaceae TaxID=118883 RepID=UPI000845C58C|nr:MULTISPECIES: phytoene/squalene synthase family protein [unclassified Sulfolobus]TRM79014.1 phytoene/squalene synthase family protein [Sulfolobus sp. B5]TRM81459.1 phytoene/squalene synthase family protein [Sulfolobus sp. D5]TRM82843.1 phytoene/squalene synthase family protein [Sulfolobus sp. A20-N-F6]TRM83071.1 phytoene/squalene synthase family protein [Sulfolobus sp. F3]TRM86578.1 phytoene/squalene synthase family protein [Sulfolobus sp. E3]TRM95319.1 phytoene/squalene synthase family pr
MDDYKTLNAIFRRGSVTYYNSTLFFPDEVRRDVTRLYAFVRVFDDLVDSIPQKVDEFYEMRDKFYRVLEGKQIDGVVLTNFSDLMKRKRIEREWVEAFLNSMESDIYKKTYYTIDETLKYMYGSAEVIGLMMMRILGLNQESSYYARMLGRAMQYLNFIRDVKEDVELGRQYLPYDEMRKFGIKSLCECNEGFKKYMRFQIERFNVYQREAEKGYKYIPLRYLIPIKTAADMYKWTANKIWHDPCVVIRVKVKPKKRRIITQGVYNSLVGVLRWLPSFIPI